MCNSKCNKEQNEACRGECKKPMAAQDEREAFEEKFPVPHSCIRVGNNYAATDYHAFDAAEYCKIRKGWLAALEYLRNSEGSKPAPAQAEPVAQWQWLHESNPKKWVDSDKGTVKLMRDAGYKTRALYAKPQTSKCSEPAATVVAQEIIDGFLVPKHGSLHADVNLPVGAKLYAEPQPLKMPELYTHISKGGEYELLGVAIPAGQWGDDCPDLKPYIYRDTKSGWLYMQHGSDFKKAMKRLGRA